MLRKLDHQNIATAQNVHYNHNLNDFSKFDRDKKNIKMYIQMEKARHDLMALTPDQETIIRLAPNEIKCIMKQIA